MLDYSKLGEFADDINIVDLLPKRYVGETYNKIYKEIVYFSRKYVNAKKNNKDLCGIKDSITGLRDSGTLYLVKNPTFLTIENDSVIHYIIELYQLGIRDIVCVDIDIVALTYVGRIFDFFRAIYISEKTSYIDAHKEYKMFIMQAAKYFGIESMYNQYKMYVQSNGGEHLIFSSQDRFEQVCKIFTEINYYLCCADLLCPESCNLLSEYLKSKDLSIVYMNCSNIYSWFYMYVPLLTYKDVLWRIANSLSSPVEYIKDFPFYAQATIRYSGVDFQCRTYYTNEGEIRAIDPLLNICAEYKITSVSKTLDDMIPSREIRSCYAVTTEFAVQKSKQHMLKNFSTIYYIILFQKYCPSSQEMQKVRRYLSYDSLCILSLLPEQYQTMLLRLIQDVEDCLWISDNRYALEADMSLFAEYILHNLSTVKGRSTNNMSPLLSPATFFGVQCHYSKKTTSLSGINVLGEDQENMEQEILELQYYDCNLSGVGNNYYLQNQDMGLTPTLLSVVKEEYSREGICAHI